MRFDLTETVKALMQEFPEHRFCYYSREPDAAALLVLNACPSGCAEVPEFSGKTGIFSVGYDAGDIPRVKQALFREAKDWIQGLS